MQDQFVHLFKKIKNYTQNLFQKTTKKIKVI